MNTSVRLRHSLVAFALINSLVLPSVTLVARAETNAKNTTVTQANQPASTDARQTLERGKALFKRGRAGEALPLLESALQAYTAKADDNGAAAAHDALGELYERQGQYKVALSHYRSAHASFVKAESKTGALEVLGIGGQPYNSNLMLAKIGNTYIRMNDLSQARSSFNEMKVSAPGGAAAGEKKKSGGMLGGLSSAASIASNVSSGANAASTALSIANTVNQAYAQYRQLILYSTYEIGVGRIDYQTNDLSGAKTHFENALNAAGGSGLNLVGQFGQSSRFRIAARTGLGDVAYRQNRYADAVKLYTEAANGARKDKRIDLMWAAQRGIGNSRWAQATGERDQKKATKGREDALAAYREAITAIETLRAGSIRADEARTTFLATTKDVYDEAAANFAEMALLTSGAGSASSGALNGKALDYANEAFKITEQSRARSLLDLLAETGAEITANVPADLLQRRRTNFDRQQQIASQLSGVEFGGEKKQSAKDLDAELATLQVEYDQIENQIRNGSPRYAQLTQSPTLTLADAQTRILDDNSTLLEYMLGAERSYLFAVTKTGAQLYRLPARRDIETQVVALRDQIVPVSLRHSIINTSPDQAVRGIGLGMTVPNNTENAAASQPAPPNFAPFVRASNQLYTTMIAPAASVIKDKRLIIIADGALNYVPFGSFVQTTNGADFSQLDYLIKTNEIVNAPSASVLAVLHSEQRANDPNARGMLLIADPIFDGRDPRLNPRANANAQTGTTPRSNNQRPAATPTPRAGRAGGRRTGTRGNAAPPAQSATANQSAQSAAQPSSQTADTSAAAQMNQTNQQMNGAQGNATGGQTRGLGLGVALADVAGAPAPEAGANNAVAPSNFSLVRLPGTRTEAEQIAVLARSAGTNVDTWLDLEASEANLLARDAKKYRVIHVATHGLLDAERPQFSGVVLSLVGNREQDGFLRTDEVFNLRLSSPLVMLSACETGLGKERRGEGVIGLTRAFMYAGAPTVGVSLWSVSDRSTVDLMTDFYRGYLNQQTSQTASAAMRDAQVKMIAGKRYAQPFFWSPFVLVGDWR